MGIVTGMRSQPERVIQCCLFLQNPSRLLIAHQLLGEC
jgi:hypothetical protein